MTPTWVALIVLLCSRAALLTCSGSTGFRIELTHVDARANYTTSERVRRAVDRSRQRLATVVAAADVSAPVRWVQTQYIAGYDIGDPPQRAEALIDTGSDIVWTQCATCGAASQSGCFHQRLPYYDSSASRSARPVPCTDAACLASNDNGCARDGSSCAFTASYGAGSIAGLLDTEAFAFQSGTANLAFGCVSASRLTTGALDGASGIIGLGRGSLSLVSQTDATRFSYCLTPYFGKNAAPSKLFVGATASLSGGAGASPVMSMPFVKSPSGYPGSTFYYLPLVGMTVGQTKLPIPSTVLELRQDGTGGVIIDSGSPFTSLVDGAYQALREELARQLSGSLVPPPAANSGLDLCVAQDDVKKLVPALVLHFSGGADMALPPENYWAPADDHSTTACMMVFSSGGGMDPSIIGNFQQQNTHLLYDVGGGELSFQTAVDCSAL